MEWSVEMSVDMKSAKAPKVQIIEPAKKSAHDLGLDCFKQSFEGLHKKIEKEEEYAKPSVQCLQLNEIMLTCRTISWFHFIQNQSQIFFYNFDVQA